MIHEYTYASHPFDVVGWDGYNFPYAFSIHENAMKYQEQTMMHQENYEKHACS